MEKENADGTSVWIFDANNEPGIQNLRRGGILARLISDLHGFIVYIVVDDIHAIIKRVQELNGSVMSPIINTGAGRLVLIADPCGNQFGLSEDMQPGS